MNFELFTLGTVSACPTKYRNVSAACLRYGGNVYMIDCGEGTQHQLLRSEIKPSKIDKILITHLHGDHIFGLPGLLCTISNLQSPERVGIDLYGPVGLRSYIRFSLKASESHLAFKYRVHELVPRLKPSKLQSSTTTTTSTSTPLEFPESQFKSIPHDPSLHENEEIGTDIELENGCWSLGTEPNGISIIATPLTHKVATVGYAFLESDKPGKLDADLATKLGIKDKKDFGKLKKGESVTTPEGKVIKPEEVMEPPIKGRKVVYLRDTCNSDAMIPFAQDCSLLVHEATHGNELKEKAIECGHSTPEMAGEFAKKVRARKLLLTHFSARYRTPLTFVNPKSKEQLESAISHLTQASTIIGSTPQWTSYHSSLVALLDRLKDDSDPTIDRGVDVNTLVQQAKAAFGSDAVIAAEDLMKISVTFDQKN